MLLLTACPAATTPGPVATPSSRPATLGANDVFEVRIYQEPDLSGSYRIASDGTIVFPLLGTLQVAGMTPPEVADLITRRLRDGYIKNPQVTLAIKEYNSKKISVLGAVSKPGEYPYVEDMSIVSAIAQAGGFTRVSAPNETTVTRVVDQKEVRITVRVDDIGKGREKNFALVPGDIVVVPESIF
ncbi:MAG: polysaccharide biosynthesis/export family protein [Deltaproteobacteria bacterium]|nr:polysaccharide biosynthesis/export family protein [Deltaproteobacteria bacterium]